MSNDTTHIPTPRTDAAVFTVYEYFDNETGVLHEIVDADFARQLERELAQANRKLERELEHSRKRVEAYKADLAATVHRVNCHDKLVAAMAEVKPVLNAALNLGIVDINTCRRFMAALTDAKGAAHD